MEFLKWISECLSKNKQLKKCAMKILQKIVLILQIRKLEFFWRRILLLPTYFVSVWE